MRRQEQYPRLAARQLFQRLPAVAACVVRDCSVSLPVGERGKKDVPEPLLERGGVRRAFVAPDRAMLPLAQRGDHVCPPGSFPGLHAMDICAAGRAAVFALEGAAHAAFVHADALSPGNPLQPAGKLRAFPLGLLAIREGFFFRVIPSFPSM